MVYHGNTGDLISNNVGMQHVTFTIDYSSTTMPHAIRQSIEAGHLLKGHGGSGIQVCNQQLFSNDAA